MGFRATLNFRKFKVLTICQSIWVMKGQIMAEENNLQLLKSYKDVNEHKELVIGI